jgi:hypothetical protein
MFVFLCERARIDPSDPPHEREIAEIVFGRGEDFDPRFDPLVRVQASTLRAKLRLHFSAEGANEPVVVEIPKGAYVPVFRARGPIDDDVDPAPAAPVTRAWWPLALLGALCAVLLVAAVAPHVRPRAWYLRERSSEPALRALWGQLLGHGLDTTLVLADSELSAFQEATHQWLSAAAYQRRQFRPPLDQSSTDLGDALLAYRFGTLAAALGGHGEVVHAREATDDRFRSGHVILSGWRRANPWVELFDERLAFRSRFDKDAQVPYFSNTSPQPGEPPQFRPTPENGYCRIALLVKPGTAGNVLMLTGTDAASTRAGIQLVVEEAPLADLARALGVAEGRPFSPFEVVLRVPLGIGAPRPFVRVAFRSG